MSSQPDDLQAFLSGNSAKPSYMAMTVRVRSPKDVPQVEEAIKQLGFGNLFLLDATKSLRLVFTVFDLSSASSEAPPSPSLLSASSTLW